MSNLVPDLYIGMPFLVGLLEFYSTNLDTMGYAFTFHVASFLGRIPVGAYVHYPTISTDMLARVRSRKNWHTNTPIVSSSAFLSRIKLLYVITCSFFDSYWTHDCPGTTVSSCTIMLPPCVPHPSWWWTHPGPKVISTLSFNTMIYFSTRFISSHPQLLLESWTLFVPG